MSPGERIDLASAIAAWSGTVTVPGGKLISDGALLLVRSACANPRVLEQLEGRRGARQVTAESVERAWARYVAAATHPLAIAEPVRFFDGGRGLRLSNGAYLELRRFDLLQLVVGWPISLRGSGARDPVVAVTAWGMPVAIISPLRVAGCAAGEWN